MTLCDDGHDEVCYIGRFCPVCEKIQEIKELEEKIQDLNNEIDLMR